MVMKSRNVILKVLDDISIDVVDFHIIMRILEIDVMLIQKNEDIKSMAE